MDLTQSKLLETTRRHFFGQCAVGLGQMALASLLRNGSIRAGESTQPINPLTSKAPHFPSKAKSVIYLFMAGGPSQLDLFEHKPKLVELTGKPIPESFLKGKRFAFMDSFSREVPKLLARGGNSIATGSPAGTFRNVSPILGVWSTTWPSSRRLQEQLQPCPAKIFLNTARRALAGPAWELG
jgi:hypothetical protein